MALQAIKTYIGVYYVHTTQKYIHTSMQDYIFQQILMSVLMTPLIVLLMVQQKAPRMDVIRYVLIPMEVLFVNVLVVIT